MNTFTRIVIPLLVSFLCTLSYGQNREIDSVNIDSMRSKVPSKVYQNEQIEKLKKQMDELDQN